MIRRSMKILFTALPFILSFIRDFRRFILFGSERAADLEFHQKRAQRLTKKIASIGPSFIKLTQVISTRADIIPPLYLRELSKLHDEVPPVPFSVVKKVLAKEYHRPFEEVFESFDPTPLAAAVAQVEAWLESPSLVLLPESEGYWPELRTALQSGRVAGAQVHDARIAALCQLHGVRELWSADRDFSRFFGLTVRNPLIG